MASFKGIFLHHYHKLCKTSGKRIALKSISLLIALSMLAQDLLYANPDSAALIKALPSFESKLSIPESVGEIEDTYVSSPKCHPREGGDRADPRLKHSGTDQLDSRLSAKGGPAFGGRGNDKLGTVYERSIKNIFRQRES